MFENDQKPKSKNNELPEAFKPQQAPLVQQPQEKVATFSSGTPQASTRFGGFQKFLTANQPAGQQLTSNIGGQVRQQVQKATDTSAFAPLSANIEKESARITTGEAQLLNAIKTNPQSVFSDPNRKAAALKLIQNQNLSPELKNQLQDMYNKSGQAMQSAAQVNQQLGSEAGRFGLLQKRFGSSPYSAGQQLFDQALLQQQAGGLEQQQAAQQAQLQTSAESLDAFQKAQAANIAALQQKASEASTELKGALSEETQKLVSAQEAEAKALNQANVKANEAFAKLKSTGYDSLNAEEKSVIDPILKAGGLTGTGSLYGVDVGQFYKGGSDSLKAKDVLSQQELSQYQALAGLSGLTPEQQAFQDYGSGSNITKSGFDTSALGKAMAEGRAAAAPQEQAVQTAEKWNKLGDLMNKWESIGGDWNRTFLRDFWNRKDEKGNPATDQWASTAREIKAAAEALGINAEAPASKVLEQVYANQNAANEAANAFKRKYKTSFGGISGT